MIAEVTKSDLVIGLRWAGDLLKQPDMATAADLMDEVVGFDGALVIRKKFLKLGSLKLRIKLQATPEGHLELDIDTVSFNLFGGVRKAVTTMILKSAKKFEPRISAFKNDKGNVTFRIADVHFNRVVFAGDVLTLDVSFT